MKRISPLALALLPLTLFGLGCGAFGTDGAGEQPTPPPAVTVPPVAPPSVVTAASPVLMVACKTQGGDTFVPGTGLYRTVGENVYLLSGVKPDGSDDLCLTKAGSRVELTCFTEGGACAADVKITGIAGAKAFTHSPTAIVEATVVGAAGSSDVSLSWLQGRAIALGRAVTGLQGSDKKQTAALEALCEGNDSAGCKTYRKSTVTPVPAEMTTEGAASATPASAPAATPAPVPAPVVDIDTPAPPMTAAERRAARRAAAASDEE